MKKMLFAWSVALAACAAEPPEPDTFEEMVPMPDGVKLYTYGVRPPAGVKCPIVVVRTPYVPEKPVDLAAFAKGQRGNFARTPGLPVHHQLPEPTQTRIH